MASPAASSVLLVLLAAFTASASAATFSIVNNCGFTVWPAAIPVGGGLQLNPGQMWTLNVPAGTSSCRIWGRTGCSFNGGSGSCQTGDCAGALSCTLSGQPPATLAEFSIGGATDSYDISVIDGYNLAMDFSCSNGDAIRCRNSGCPDANDQPNDTKGHICTGNNNYQVIFCP
ncbi:thaumatin-like pathogenesis-related protein 4 [Phragmites australis]|uniref:thaumatin-like pathogenesis-related protein 4 n=1 Tax=Phragmites australis TaxID=29695 RepID=UPI002D7865D0|nr:thaumatin-like pathogenesis-related protein 4 [Phragmites australis]